MAWTGSNQQPAPGREHNTTVQTDQNTQMGPRTQKSIQDTAKTDQTDSNSTKSGEGSSKKE